MERIRALLTREEPVRWLFTGDSITHGALHTYGWRDYTELFSERVRWELRRTRDVVIKTGISGWTIARIAADLEWNVLQFRPHCVSIAVGMNDCTRGPEALPAFRETYLATIERIRKEAGAALLLHTPNGTLPTGGQARVEHLPAYAEAIRALAREAHVPVVDHFAAWNPAGRSADFHAWIGHGCHPNEHGHRMMAHTLFRALGIWDEASDVCRLFVPPFR